MSSHITKELINLLEKQIGGESSTEIPDIQTPYEIITLNNTNNDITSMFFLFIIIFILVILFSTLFRNRSTIKKFFNNDK